MANNFKNPAFLANRLQQCEKALSRQIALNNAAADTILRLEEELSKLGSYIVALVKRSGSRVEFTMEELQAMAASDLEVHYSYPTQERQTFIMQLAARGATPGEPGADQTEAELEAQLRAAGVPQKEIDKVKAGVAEHVEQALSGALTGGGAVNPIEDDSR